MYATFSHKWEVSEPLFNEVVNMVVYDLEEYPTHDKLQMFCKTVRDAGYHWAWSDTCCINKADHFVLQEALVAMFKWYQGSSLTVIFLRGVGSLSRRGALVRSIWNTRAWTLQEYHASKVVRFHTEDWTMYLDLDIPNHKDAPEIISEMEEATGVPVRVLMGLRPGFNDIREKLCLAAQRETTFVEDAAYSLLGIFSATLPVVYGEGDRSLGRLLVQLLESSGDTSLLAWTGQSGSFNSCLPANITVFSQRPTTHIPSVDRQVEMDTITSRLQPLLPFTMELYDRLCVHPVPFFAGRRMKLPCIIFELRPLTALWNSGDSEYVFRAEAGELGTVEIKTKENLSLLKSLYIIHPWIDFLLDRQPVRSVMETIREEGGAPSEGKIPTVDPDSPGFDGPPTTSHQQRSTPPHNPPATGTLTDKETRALRLLFRLCQPFGALLLTPDIGNVAAYRRIATDSPIRAQVSLIAPTIVYAIALNVRVLDVL